MSGHNFSQTAAFLWSVADLLRGDFKQSQYGRIILPFTLLRRLECVLADSKAKVLAILDYSSVMQLQDVQAIHAQVLPVLPTGTPADPAKLLYVKIRTSSNAIVVLALNWISAQPVLDGATEVTVTISNISTADIPRISAALHANGFNSFAFVS